MQPGLAFAGSILDKMTELLYPVISHCAPDACQPEPSLSDLTVETAPKPDKRVAILEAGLRLFGQYGYRRTSMEDIAREADIAKGTIYLYFASKEDLFAALSAKIADDVLSAARRAAETAGPFADRMIAVLDAKVGFFQRWVAETPHAEELIASKDHLSGDAFTKFDVAYRRLLAELVSAADAAGEIDLAGQGLSAEEAADTLLSAAYGAGSGVYDEKNYSLRFDRILRLMIAGLSRRA